MASESLFFSLPARTQRKIDFAFDSVCKKLIAKSRSEEMPVGGFIPESGGFIRDNEGDLFAGGFIREEKSDDGFLHDGGGFLNDDELEEEKELTQTAHTRIPLSLISSALQHLDLPPDDDEILTVFRNAATGWTSSNNDASDLQSSRKDDQYVSRDDWRSVCAVLLEHDAEEHDGPEEDMEMAGPGIESGGAANSDEYHGFETEVEGVEDDDSGGYVEGPSTSAIRRRTRRTAHRPSPSPSRSSMSPDNQPHKLTSRQRQTCIDAYSLFFPTAPAEELLSQRIMIKDLQSIAKLLNEKLKTEDMIEMLEAFSTSPDKSMSFEDFCSMMIKAKLA